ncbi:MAG: hypothetical protein CXX80_02510 [Methanobacteriota archaeon]|nr:MAG: hypothetical protein CXX80_02510 [Euryarchaeota archaeon]
MMAAIRPSFKSTGMVLLFLISLLVWSPPAIAEDIGDPTLLQAQDINATFDPHSESTTVTWRNINNSIDSSLFEELWDVTYHVYRHDQPLDTAAFAGLTPFAIIDACDEFGSGSNPNNCRGTEDRHPGHSVTYQIPPGVNGSFYYAIVSEHGDGTLMENLDVNASTLYTPVEEVTSPVRSPYFLQASYVPTEMVTTLTWVNYNVINPVLPVDGDDAYRIHLWRSTNPITRSNGMTMLSTESPIAVLVAGESSYDVPIPISTTRTSYYAITYLLPNWAADGSDYEDVRFLSGNTLVDYVFEDTIPPPPPNNVIAVFTPNQYNGSGNTTITWSQLLEESGESYLIWMAGVPFSDTNRTDIELVATVQEGFSSYLFNVERGQIGYSFYCIEVIDQYGIHSLTISCATPIYEDTFTPWIAEPTNVAAEYLGDAKTRVTWTDQIGAEGEIYHIWWSNFPVPGSQFNENSSLFWVTSVPDGFGEAIADVPLGVTRDPSYYFVTSEARYGHLNGTYQYRGLIQNMAAPIIEDTLKPDDPRVTEVTMIGTTNQVIIRWVNDVGEDNEIYHIYRHAGEPFAEDGVTSDILVDAGWELIQSDIPTSNATSSVMATTVPIGDNISQNAWYAVVVADEWNNVNPTIIAGLGGNALQVNEDTIPPIIGLTIDDQESSTLLDGEHRLVITTDEELAGDPILNISSTNGKYYTIGDVPASMLSDNIADPSIGPTYYYDFSVSNTDGHGDLSVKILISDANYNSAEYNESRWKIDSVAPSINIYTPGQSTESKYMYGSEINVHGSVSDDVGINSLQIKFTYNYRQSNQATSPWMNFADSQLTWHDESVAFTYSLSSSDFQPGEHRVEIKVTDLGGNERQAGVTFLVDSCHHTINGTTICAYEQALKPDPEPIIEEVSFGDPPYIFVFGLAGLNVFAFILTLLVITISLSRGRVREDEDEGDDWMKEFIGTSTEPDMDELVGVAPEKESKAIPDVDEDDDEDDPFAVNVLQRKSRSGKKKDEDSDSGRRVVKRKK